MHRLINSVPRDGIVSLLAECDDDTKDVFETDYLPNWDNKNLWKAAPPVIALVGDKLAGVVFYNYITLSDVSGEKAVYIQRTYVVPEFRKQGIFRSLVSNVWAQAFELNCKYIYMFCNTDYWEAWEKLKFAQLLMTKEKDYNIVFTPILHIDMMIGNMMYNNFCHQHPKTQTGFWTQTAMQFIKGTALKYCK